MTATATDTAHLIDEINALEQPCQVPTNTFDADAPSEPCPEAAAYIVWLEVPDRPSREAMFELPGQEPMPRVLMCSEHKEAAQRHFATCRTCRVAGIAPRWETL